MYCRQKCKLHPCVSLFRIPEAIELFGFLPLPIAVRHGYDAGRLPGAHRDPFDRMLAAQAREGLTLVSCDPAFEALGVKTFW
jgi:PIN domain nuclease of toxin-antitoxin system